MKNEISLIFSLIGNHSKELFEDNGIFNTKQDKQVTKSGQIFRLVQKRKIRIPILRPNKTDHFDTQVSEWSVFSFTILRIYDIITVRQT